MGELRVSARAFILVVVLAGIGLLVVQWPSGVWPSSGGDLVALGLLALASILADIWQIRLHFRGVVYTLSTAVFFALMLIFGPLVAAVIGATASAVGDVWERRAWYKTLFNAATVVIYVSAAGVVYAVLNDGTLLPLASPRNALAIVASGLVYITVAGLLICTIVGLVQGHGPWSVYRASLRSFHFQMIALVPIGALIVIVYYQNIWGLVLLLFPIILTHSSFQAYERLRADAQRTMETLAEAVDRRDHYTYRHSERVAEFCEAIARQMKLDLQETETLVAAARVHDLGKIGITSEVLLKPGKLDAKEWALMQEHPRIGAEIIAKLTIYDQVRGLVACHQERYDGRGYPYGLKGKQIPLGARIIAVADAYEAMTADRPYRKALDQETALGELRRGRGTQFDPEVVDAFLAALNARESAADVAEPAVAEPARVALGRVHGNQAAG